jgi:hypothetical protein
MDRINSARADTELMIIWERPLVRERSAQSSASVAFTNVHAARLSGRRRFQGRPHVYTHVTQSRQATVLSMPRNVDEPPHIQDSTCRPNSVWNIEENTVSSKQRRGNASTKRKDDVTSSLCAEPLLENRKKKKK